MVDATCVLLVEDDRNIVDLIRSNLTVRGYSVVVSLDGSDVLRLVEEERPDIALIDLMLPAADGFELCRAIRERHSIGLIVVSARGGESDKVRALNLGADDYLTKPFGIDELLARITATLRRTRPLTEPVGPEPRLVFGDLEIDLEARSVSRAERTDPPDADRVRPPARVRPATRASCSATPRCCGGCGAPATPPRPSTPASTCGGCGPSSNKPAARPSS